MQMRDPNAESDSKSKELPEKLKDFGRKIKAQRERAGLRVTELATLLGVKPAYIYLIETARRIPREGKARELARILNDDVDLYVEWARAHRRKAGTWHADADQRGAEEHRHGAAPDVGILTGEEVRFVRGRIARKATRGPGDSDESQAKGFYRIPIIPPSESAGTDFIELKRSICPAGEQLASPFAYRVPESSIGRVRNVLKAGDTVVFTADIGVPDPKKSTSFCRANARSSAESLTGPMSLSCSRTTGMTGSMSFHTAGLMIFKKSLLGALLPSSGHTSCIPKPGKIRGSRNPAPIGRILRQRPILAGIKHFIHCQYLGTKSANWSITRQ